MKVILTGHVHRDACELVFVDEKPLLLAGAGIRILPANETETFTIPDRRLAVCKGCRPMPCDSSRPGGKMGAKGR